MPYALLKVNRLGGRLATLPGVVSAVGVIVVLLANPTQTNAQLRSATTSGTEFEVASIKPNNSGLLGVTGIHTDPVTLTIVNYPLFGLVRQAYGVKEYQVLGGPSWFNMDRYDINAKAPSNVGQDQLMLMLQTLLMERFKLSLHQESREMSSYVMVVEKNGSKLQSAKEDEKPQPVRVNPQRLTGTKVSLAQLATALSNVLRRPVADRTSTGDFDFSEPWTPDGGASPSTPEFFYPLLSVIQDRLGIRLIPQKSSVDVLIIDHAEKPSGN